MSKKIIIGDKVISNDGKPYFIADIAANHDGSLERAYKLIELAKEAGADAAKFQNFQAETIVSKNGFDSMGQQLSHQASWKKSVFEVYKDASLNEDWTPLLKKKCDEVGIHYMTTPYNLSIVDKVYDYVDAYKIGSGDITWSDMLEKVSKKDKPIMLATGASYFSEVERAMNIIKSNNDNIVLMQCNTNYTASAENYKYINLKVLNQYKKSFPYAVLGLSDHTYGHATVLGAIALGARVFEKHFTDDNDRIGPDHKFSMNPKTWKEMVYEADLLYESLGDGEKKLEENEKESVIVQRRSLFAKKNISAGEVIKAEDLIPLRPIQKDGIEPWNITDIIGKKVKKDIKKDDYIRKIDLYE